MSDPATCPSCKGPMKPLFTGFYCPKDCDRPHLKAAALDKQIKDAQDTMAKPQIWSQSAGAIIRYRGAWAPPVTANWTPPSDDSCRDYYCGGKGKATHTNTTPSYGFAPPHIFVHYECGTCNKKWSIVK